MLGGVQFGQQLFVVMASAPNQRWAEIAAWGEARGAWSERGGVAKGGVATEGVAIVGVAKKGGGDSAMSLGGVSPLAGLPARRVRWQRGSRCGAVRSHDLPQVRAAAAPGPPLSPPAPSRCRPVLGVGAGVEAYAAPYEAYSPFSGSCPACRCLAVRGAAGLELRDGGSELANLFWGSFAGWEFAMRLSEHPERCRPALLFRSFAPFSATAAGARIARGHHSPVPPSLPSRGTPIPPTRPLRRLLQCPFAVRA